MRKIYLVSSLFILLSSCNNSTDSADKTTGSDSVGMTNPSAIDTMKHPSGMDNSSVISTDTAAMNVQNSLKKADSAKKKDK